MATRIRLKRFGGRHDPHFRIVVSDGRKPRDGRAIEELGFYTPAGDGELEVNAERAEHWLSVGAQPSDTVRSLLQKAGVIEAPAAEETAGETAGETAEEAEAESDEGEESEQDADAGADETQEADDEGADDASADAEETQ